jgi:hypothetical protein
MPLNPRLNRFERFANATLGVGLSLYALLGGIDHLWIKIVLCVVGASFVVGGIGGT